MNYSRPIPTVRFIQRSLIFFAVLPCNLFAEEQPMPLFDLNSGSAPFAPSSKQVTVSKAPRGVAVDIQPGNESYPGVSLKPPQGVWNLSKYGHIEALVVNTGEKPITLALRVDNAGDWKDNPWNTENLTLEPGESETIATIFGHSFGHKPGFSLKPDAVSGVLIFAGKSSTAQSFRIESLQAAGPPGEKPPADPDSIRLKPENGFLIGGKVKMAASQINAGGGAEASVLANGAGMKIAFSKPGQMARVKPRQGRWDLREAHQARIKIKNTGSTAAAASARLESSGGPTDIASTRQELKPGESAELVVSFIPAVPWTGVKNLNKADSNGTEGTGTRFVSDKVSAVTFLSDKRAGSQSFEIESIVAAAPPVALPEWIGKRPPVQGEWVLTFSEDFNGKAIDLSKWNIYSANYWDKLSHFSKDNVVVENGLAKLRYVKRTGRHNDDPKGKETPYATGFLDTYGKWVQRYGYFEARMKLPKAPGLWPAMWLMPDRGIDKGEQWVRASTREGGMEFDIMEFLSRWGPHRYNIAFHWDGYDSDEHKQTGTTTIYTALDKEGFLTAGLLWTPGQAVLYCNGAIVARWESPRISKIESDLMFTHVMGGWDNDDLDDSKLPDEFVIDYVRCWQRKDLASGVDGVKSTAPTPAAPARK